MAAFPRVTFGIIVLNGEPFTRYCLRSLYPFAYEIIVVEGGHEDARSVCTPDGHSIDGTLEALWRFKREEDPENKVQIVTRDGFWPKRDELGRDRTHQSRAYAERATGDYLWQVDIDEFYRPEDMETILVMLREDPSITAVTFPIHTFWGRPDYVVDGWRFRRGGQFFHRLFKWGPGYRYVSHEPPTVYDANGRDLRTLRWVSGKTLARRGIYLYHYALLFPRQVLQKAMINRDEKPDCLAEVVEWAANDYLRLRNPYRVERLYWFPSWLDRFRGRHPPEVMRMMDDISAGRVIEQLRSMDDVERLLRSKSYQLGRLALKAAEPVDRLCIWAKRQFIRASHLPRWLMKLARSRGVTGGRA